MANISKLAQGLGLAQLTSDPSGAPDGTLYYNSSTNNLRLKKSGSFSDVTTGSVSLLGQALNDGEIIVGNASNVSAAIDTDTNGDILADHSTGLTIKSGVISNSHINTSAAIALSKLAALTATRIVVTDGSGVIAVASYAPGDVILRDGSVAFTADQSMGSNKLTNVANGSASGDAVNKSQLDLKQDLSEKGQANGYAPLDGGSKIPVQYLPSSVMEYKGVWNASTNSPTLADGAGDTGDVYRVSVAGSQDLGSGTISFSVGDYVIYNGTIWEKSDTTDAVASVNGQTGVVSLDSDDISEGATNLYFSDERAQDAVGSIVANTATINLSYNDGTPSISADVNNSSIDNNKLASDAVTNVKVAAAAAIARSKLASGTANRVVVNDGSGVMSDAAAITASRALESDANGIPVHSSVTSTELGYVSGVTSSIQTQLNGKLSNVVEDTTPQLGGPLDLNGQNVEGVMKRSAVSGGSSFMEEEYFHSITLTASQTDAVIASLTFAHGTFEALEMHYKIKEATTNRVAHGKFRVVTNGTDISFIDERNDTADVGVSFSAAINGSDVEILYTTTANNKTMRVLVNRIKA